MNNINTNFQKWFDGSKVTKDKKALIVYHGTNQNIKCFDKDKCSPYNVYGKGFYFTDSKEIANAYIGGILDDKNDDSKVMPLYLNMKNPYDLDQSITDIEIKEFQQLLKNDDDYDFWWKYMEQGLPDSDDVFPGEWETLGLDYRNINRKSLNILMDFLDRVGKWNKSKTLRRHDVYFILTDSITSKEVIKKYIISKGYDGIKYSENGTGLSSNPLDNIKHTIYVAFESNQVKHAEDNNGEYSSSNNIYEHINTFNDFNLLESVTLKEEIDEDADEVNFKLYQGSDVIGSLHSTHRYGAYDDFSQFISEDEYHSIFPDDMFIEIESVKIEDNYKGKGYGKQLLEMSLNKLKYMTKVIYLNACPPKYTKGLYIDELVKFYQSFGFEIIIDDFTDNKEMVLYTSKIRNIN
jgi:GNAT superfamily N-acetyltransferase